MVNPGGEGQLPSSAEMRHIGAGAGEVGVGAAAVCPVAQRTMHPEGQGFVAEV
jgi:hypothetical protein